MKRMLAAGLSLGLALSGSMVHAVTLKDSDPWDLVTTNQALHLQVFTRPVEGTNVREFRATGVVHTSLSSLVALIEDTDNMPNWMHRISHVSILHRNSTVDAHAYTVINAPWPYHDRDVYIHSHLTQDPQSQEIVIASRSEEGGAPLHKNYVRMPAMETDWIFRPLAHGDVEVTFRGFGLPGGLVPDWAVNLVVTDLPYGSMRGLLRQIGKEKYQNARYDFIKEPRP